MKMKFSRFAAGSHPIALTLVSVLSLPARAQEPGRDHATGRPGAADRGRASGFVWRVVAQ